MSADTVRKRTNNQSYCPERELNGSVCQGAFSTVDSLGGKAVLSYPCG